MKPSSVLLSGDILSLCEIKGTFPIKKWTKGSKIILRNYQLINYGNSPST